MFTLLRGKEVEQEIRRRQGYGSPLSLLNLPVSALTKTNYKEQKIKQATLEGIDTEETGITLGMQDLVNW